MSAKLLNTQCIGRFKRKTDLKTVNIWRGTCAQRGTDDLYYLYRYKRMFISDREFYDLWVRV